MKLAEGMPVKLLLLPASLISFAIASEYTNYCRQSRAFLLLLYLLSAAMILSFLFFFRDPEREICSEGLCSPADGTVQFVRKTDDGWHIAIFMNLHNVHVNRSPVDGLISEMQHIPGSHIPAFSKESERNERVIYRIITADGEIELIQIAGAVARRIVPYLKEGDRIKKGERIGLIRFGSRVDIYFSGFRPLVKEGDRVKAGESPLAARMEN